MKRFLAVLVFLLLVAGTAFFFGWVQLQIPAGTSAVIFTKTNGWESEVVEPGAFTWRWERLIPTNLDLYIYPDSRRTFEVAVEGSLPGSGSLTAFVDDSSAFDYSSRILVSIGIAPDALPSLAEDENLRPDTLDAYFDQIEAQATELASEALDSVLQEMPDNPGTRIEEISDSIRDELSTSFPSVSIHSVAVTALELPDTEVYQQARDLLQEVMRTRAASLQSAAADIASRQTAEENELNRLARYGEILDQYPVLLEYFRVSGELGESPLDIESLLSPESDE
jgi:hypothetical protein